jgi:hypothetical protein
MEVDPPNSPGDLYHCGDPKTGPVDDYHCEYTLCGIDIMDESITELQWDPPRHFMLDWWNAKNTMPPRCPTCMAHDDYPFLLLGEL